MQAYHPSYNYLYWSSTQNNQLLATLNDAGSFSILGDITSAGKLVLRSQTRIIDFQNPSSGEYDVRLINDTSGWLNLKGHLKVEGDLNITHPGTVNFNVNTITAGSNVTFNLQHLGNTEFMIGMQAMNVSGGHIYIATNNRPIFFSPGSSYTAFWGPVHFGPATNSIPGTAGQVLTSNGAGSAPTWQASKDNIWNGGTVTENIAIRRADPQLHLNAVSGGSAIFWDVNSAAKMSFRYSAAGSYFYLQDETGNRYIARWDHTGDYGILGRFTAGTASQYIQAGAASGRAYIEASPGVPLDLRPGSGTAVYAASDFYANNLLPRSGGGTGNVGNGSTYWQGIVAHDVYAGNLLPRSGANTGTVGNGSSYWQGAVINSIYANSVEPRNGHYTGSLGTSSRAWESLYCRVFNGKQNGNWGCERSKSGQEWPHMYNDYYLAAEALSHELTKTKYHLIYDSESEDKIVCICGKKVVQPCPECETAWRDKYIISLDLLTNASGYMTLEHAATLTQLQQHNHELEEHNTQLEQRLTTLEQKLDRLLQLAVSAAD